MNNTATSKEEILKTSRKLIQENGWTGVNIRSVAAACGVSVGCIYNYFDSKTALVGATVASVWGDIFHHPDDEAVLDDALECIRWMYRQMEYGCQTYPGFFTHHSLSFMQQDTADGKRRMHHACSISSISFVWCSGATLGCARMPLPISFLSSNLPRSCSRSCSLP